MKILYVNFIDMNNVNSGSGVRPVKMLQAMQRLGYEVDLITGYSRFAQRKTRKKQIDEAIIKIKQKKYDFCYIEPPSGIISRFYNNFEYKLLKVLKKNKIPTGIFYRDIHWKFTKQFIQSKIKRIYVKLMQNRDFKVLRKYCDIFFVPTKTMGEYLNGVKRIIPLPPGCENKEVSANEFNEKEVIYVGGTSKNYGTDILLEAFEILNNESLYKLNLICREKETEIIYSYFNARKLPEWLNIIHAGFDQVTEYYNKAAFAVFSPRVSEYFNFSMPIKIFEYISFLKPIVTTNCEEIGCLIKDNHLGLVCKDNAKDLADTIIKMSECHKDYREALCRYRENNLWESRVHQIADELSQKCDSY